jgi:hypothetical protein
MSSAPPEPPGAGAAARRDAGLRRISRLTRWLVAGALLLTAALSTIAARTFPGQSNSQSSTTSTSAGRSTGTGSSSSDDRGSDSQSTLQSPGSAPSASGGSGSVTSGGS